MRRLVVVSFRAACRMSLGILLWWSQCLLLTTYIIRASGWAGLVLTPMEPLPMTTGSAFKSPRPHWDIACPWGFSRLWVLESSFHFRFLLSNYICVDREVGPRFRLPSRSAKGDSTCSGGYEWHTLPRLGMWQLKQWQVRLLRILLWVWPDPPVFCYLARLSPGYEGRRGDCFSGDWFSHITV